MAGVRAKASTAAPGSVYGIGVDILRVERMEKLLDRHGQKLLTRLLFATELCEVCARKNRARALAMCGAATEACVKATGTGIDGIGWKEVGLNREANELASPVFEPK